MDSGDTAHLAMMQRPDLGVTFTKLHCWTLTHYSKCVFMDADTMVRSLLWFVWNAGRPLVSNEVQRVRLEFNNLGVD